MIINLLITETFVTFSISIFRTILMKNFIHYYGKNAFQYFFSNFLFLFLTGAVSNYLSSNIAQKFLYILLDLCDFFRILETGDKKKLYVKNEK